MTALTLISRVRPTAVTSTQTYAFLVERLSDSHVEAYINGVLDGSATLTSTTVTFVDTVTTGDSLLVKRVTPRTLATQQVDFTNGANAVAEDFDTLQTQLLYLIQETQDDALESAANKEADGNLTAGSRKIEDMLDGVLSQDAATKGQLDLIQTSGGSLPSVSAGNNDSGLFVSGGAWATRTPTQSRAHMGLGSASLEDSGATAGDLVPLDADAQVPLVNSQKPMVIVPLSADFNMASGSASWLTDSSGTLHRVGFGTGIEAFDDAGDITVAATNVTVAAGTYEIEAHTLFSNRHAGSNISQPEWAITNSNGVQVYIEAQTGYSIAPNSGAGYTYAGSVYTNFVTFGGATTMFFRMRNNGAVTTTWADRTGTFLKITRIK